MCVEEQCEEEETDLTCGIFTKDPLEIARELPRPVRPARDIPSTPQVSKPYKLLKPKAQRNPSDPYIPERGGIKMERYAAAGVPVISVF